MSKIWPQSMIRELLATASLMGEAKAELASPLDAQRFRFAIYSFRKTNNIGWDISITIDDNTVVATKKKQPVINLLPTENLAYG